MAAGGGGGGGAMPSGDLDLEARLNEDDIRSVDLMWNAPSGAVPGTTMYEVQYRIAAGEEGYDGVWSSSMKTVETVYMLDDDMLNDGVVYDVRVRMVEAGQAAYEGWLPTQVLGPAIHLSPVDDLEARNEEEVEHALPIPNLAKGTVTYLIEPALPSGLMYETEPDEDEASVITGMVVGGWDQYHRLTVTDTTDDGIEMDVHYFRVTIEEVQVKPLADVIRDRTYYVDQAITQLLDFPEVGTNPNNYTYHIDGLPNGLAFDGMTRMLSGTPEASALNDDGSAKVYKLKYQARPIEGQAPPDIIHEAKFNITIDQHVCNNGLDYEQTYTTFEGSETVGSANFTIGATDQGYYVLPIGEEGDQGRLATQTRTFEIRTVDAGGDLTAPEAEELPLGLQMVQLMVDEDSQNPGNMLFTRQGEYGSDSTVTSMAMAMYGMYDDPEPDYPDMDTGERLAIGIGATADLKAGRYSSCFIVHDTDENTGEVDSSAVVFDLNIVAGLAAQDWVIELKAVGETTELDTNEAFTAPAEELNFTPMYVAEDAVRGTDGCVADADDDPSDIVDWEVDGTEVIFTSKTAADVPMTLTQRIQVKAERKSGGAEACVQVRMTVHGPLGAFGADEVEAAAATGSIHLSWDAVDNATGYRAVAIKLGSSPLTMADITVMELGDDETMHRFMGLSAGDRYLVAVVADQKVGDDTESILGLPATPILTVQ